MLNPQDLYILLKVCCLKDSWTFQSVSEQIFISPSQIHTGLKRAEISGLFSQKNRKINKSALQEFVIHGAKYAYPAERGGLILGIPTSFAGPPLNTMIVKGDAPQPVWQYPGGSIIGYSIKPLHLLAPKAALLDNSFYELLALVDAIREGRARERRLAETEIQKRLTN